MFKGTEHFDNRFPIVFVAGTIVLLPLSPLLGYLGRKIRIAYELDFIAGLYIATAPHLLFFMFLGGWFMRMAWKQARHDRENDISRSS